MNGIGTEVSGNATVIALPDVFSENALAFPSRVRSAIAEIDSPHKAADVLAQADALKHYARRIGADLAVQNAIAEGRLLLVRKTGEMLIPIAKSKGGRPKKNRLRTVTSFQDVLDELNLNKVRAAEWQKLAKIPDQKFDEYVSTAKNNSEEINMAGALRYANHVHVSANSGNIEWRTPAKYIEAARQVLGSINLDPASCAFAQQQVRATTFFTAEDDGLQKHWVGRVWLNPPYHKSLVAQFVGKLCGHVDAGDVTAAVLLVNNATDTTWFQRALESAAAVCFPRGRIRFESESRETTAPLQGQTMLYFGDDVEAFERIFRVFGHVMPAQIASSRALVGG